MREARKANVLVYAFLQKRKMKKKEANSRTPDINTIKN